MVYDFHTHSFHSDGALLPIELIRRAVAQRYRVIGVTDHVSPGNLAMVVSALVADCRLAEKYWEVRAVAGVELTHLPPEAIGELAREARGMGAELIVVHGETPVEPVPPGTNMAAVRCAEVDVLAHPGLLGEEEARLAAEAGVFLEISSRKGHSLANGRVVAVGRKAGAQFLVNSDTHEPGDLLTAEKAEKVALCAGLDKGEAEIALQTNPTRLLEKIELRKRSVRA